MPKKRKSGKRPSKTWRVFFENGEMWEGKATSSRHAVVVARKNKKNQGKIRDIVYLG